ncbi:MAG: ribonuclease III domain-containing protein [Gammaproteobacteria bacterium]
MLLKDIQNMLALWSQKDMWQSAYIFAEQIVARCARVPAAYYLRGSISARMGNLDQSIADFTTAIEQFHLQLDPSEIPFVYFDRGCAYVAKGEFEKANRDFESILAKDPEHANALVATAAIAKHIYSNNETVMAKTKRAANYMPSLECKSQNHYEKTLASFAKVITPSKGANKSDDEVSTLYLAQMKKRAEAFRANDLTGLIKMENQKLYEYWAKQEGIAQISIAILDHDLEKVKTLLTPITINQQDKWGRTPLHYAAMTGFKVIIDLLQKTGADSAIYDFSLRRPADYALEQGHSRTGLDLLVKQTKAPSPSIESLLTVPVKSILLPESEDEEKKAQPAKKPIKQWVDSLPVVRRNRYLFLQNNTTASSLHHPETAVPSDIEFHNNALELLGKLKNMDIDMDINLLKQALTTAGNTGYKNYDRLEFLGDSFLKYAVSAYLYIRFPDWDEEKCTIVRAQYVGNQALLNRGMNQQLKKYLKLSRGDIQKETNNRTIKEVIGYKVISDVVEALIGAAFIYGGETNAKAMMAFFGLPSDFTLSAEVLAGITTDNHGVLPLLDPVPDPREEQLKETLIRRERIACKLKNAKESSDIINKTISQLQGDLQETQQRLVCYDRLEAKGLQLPPSAKNEKETVSIKILDIQSSLKEMRVQLAKLEDSCIEAKTEDTFLADQESRFKVEVRSPSAKYLHDKLLPHLQSQIPNIEQQTDHIYNNKSLLKESMTHGSYVYREWPTYQRLEFLGDSILEFIISCEIIRNYPAANSGELTLIRQQLNNVLTLGIISMKAQLDLHLLHYSPAVRDSCGTYNSRYQAYEKQHTMVNGVSASDQVLSIRMPLPETLEVMGVPKLYSDLLEARIGAVFVDSRFSFTAASKLYYRLRGMMTPHINYLLDTRQNLYSNGEMSLYKNNNPTLFAAPAVNDSDTVDDNNPGIRKKKKRKERKRQELLMPMSP